MISMKSSVYRYARRQAHREFNRAYYNYSRNKGNYTNRNKTGNGNNELSDMDIVIGACVVIGIFFFMLVVYSL